MTVAIVGGGPAGVVLAYLLSRQAIPVTLFELHNDFDREFRGDTVHASTLELFEQLGLIDQLLELPHERVEKATINTPEGVQAEISLLGIRSKYPFMAMMPQSQLLNYLVEQCKLWPSFRCEMGAAVTGLLGEQGAVTGLRYRQDGVNHEYKADLVVGSDGRFSRLRKLAGFEAQVQGAPMDVVWARLPRHADDPSSNAGFFVNDGTFLVLVSRGDAWQLGYVFAKGDFANVRRRGITVLQRAVASAAPFLADRVKQLSDWDQVHLLVIQSDRLPQWSKSGLLLIGDAAHAMSPVGGVGINCAIGDAVAAANTITEPLLAGTLELSHLQTLERIRFPMIRRIQRVQTIVQNRIVALAIDKRPFRLPWLVRLILKIPILRRLPANFVARGPATVRLDARWL